MDPELRHVEITVLVLGFLAVAGIIYESYYLTDMPSGYAVLPAVPSCCGDCSCARKDVCYVCGGCCWASGCTECVTGIGSQGFKLVNPKRVADDSSFNVNAVVKTNEDRKLLIDLRLPNGFALESKSPVLVDLRAGEPEVVVFRVHVKEHVAEQDHIIRAIALDSYYGEFSSAAATVNVYWG
jgi:hypothetical protein